MGLIGDIWDVAAGAYGMITEGKRRHEAREIDKRNYKRQKEFAQNSIMWRVQDARRAGLHPLFALSGQGSSFTPSSVMVDGGGQGLEQMGQGVKNIANRLQNSEEKQLATANLEVLRAAARKDDAIAHYYNNEAGRDRNNNQLVSADRGGVWIREDADNNVVKPFRDSISQVAPDVIKLKPDEIISPRSADRSVSAGTHSFWKEYTILGDGGRNIKVQLPFSEEGPSEALSEMPFWFMPIALYKNRHLTRDDWNALIGRDAVEKASAPGAYERAVQRLREWYRNHPSLRR